MQIIQTITPQMERKTANKYKAWDNVQKNNILETGTDVEINNAYVLLRDPTIYAYAFFRDPKNPRKRFKLYPYQDIIINDPSPRVMFAAANQIGKSISLVVKAVIYAILNPGKTVLMASKTMPQAKDLLRQIKMFLRASILDYQYDIGDSDTKTDISFKHYQDEEYFDENLQETFVKRVLLPESRIICTPATEAALGYAVDLALVDELAFYDDGRYFYEQILEPRTYTTKGQIIVFSNPNGQQGIFWKLWNNIDFSRYRFNYLDCPTNNEEEFERNCRGKTREQIDSTMLAVFTSPEGGFLTLQEREKMQENRPSIIPSVITEPIYIFFDWAKTGDRTVRIIATAKRVHEDDWADEVYIHEMKEYPSDTPYNEIIDVDLKNLVKRLGPQKIAMVGWDNTGVGKGLQDFIERIKQFGIPAMPVEFSLQNKSRIYTLFKLLAENRRIKMPFIEECDKQLSMLRFKTTSRGYLQVHHENERDRDDFPDAIAGVCSLIISPEIKPISCEII